MYGVYLKMVWLILFITIFVITIILLPRKSWEALWPIGIISVLLLYAIDSTFVSLGAFSFSYGNQLLSGLPSFYLLSSFFAGIIVVNYYPNKRRLQLLYILLAAFILLIVELLMLWIDYFHYNNWNTVKSYFLNLFGFIIILYFKQWIPVISKQNSKP